MVPFLSHIFESIRLCESCPRRTGIPWHLGNESVIPLHLGDENLFPWHLGWKLCCCSGRLGHGRLGKTLAAFGMFQLHWKLLLMLHPLSVKNMVIDLPIGGERGTGGAQPGEMFSSSSAKTTRCSVCCVPLVLYPRAGCGAPGGNTPLFLIHSVEPLLAL